MQPWLARNSKAPDLIEIVIYVSLSLVLSLSFSLLLSFPHSLFPSSCYIVYLVYTVLFVYFH